MSQPASIKCVAKLWRNVWAVTRFLISLLRTAAEIALDTDDLTSMIPFKTWISTKTYYNVQAKYGSPSDFATQLGIVHRATLAKQTTPVMTKHNRGNLATGLFQRVRF